MINLNKYRIIDLTHELLPGERKLDGHYRRGVHHHNRPIEVEEFICSEARMHFLHTETHLGTHAEAPYKYSETGADIASMPLSSYMGEAVACNFAHKKAGETVTSEDFRNAGVKTGDIVLAWCSRDTPAPKPYITYEAIDWLIETRIKMLGLENLRYSPPETPLGPGDADCKLLLAGITMVDDLKDLDRIKKPRVFFMALPMKLRRVTAISVRAVALEDLDD